MAIPLPTAKKPLECVGSSKRDLKDLPVEVKSVFTYALFLAEQGAKHPDAKPMRGYGGAGVLEVVDDFDGDTYRAIYTLKFPGVVYLLHVFQKKSKRGNATPKFEIDVINKRLKTAEDHYKQHYAPKTKTA